MKRITAENLDGINISMCKRFFQIEEWQMR